MKQTFDRHFFVFVTFILSFLIMTLAFAHEQLFPFGNNQIMIIDSWHQYYPFLQELHAKLQNGESLFYSWNTGAGTNFIVLMAYYAMSPMNLLSALFPQAYLREFMLFATITKIAMAGAFFAIYVRGVFKRNDLSLVVFGLMYAFSAYAMGYYWCWMWLDGMALLPLIILGLHRVLEEEGFVLYTVSLAVALVSSFYIGYFICEFIVIYATALYAMKFGWRGIRHLLQKIFDTVMYSFMGAGLAALTLVPTYYGMRRAYGLSSGDPKAIETYYSLLDILNNLLANVPPTIKNGMPNIYSGILALLLVIFYFLNVQVALRHKVINFILILFFLFSFNINYMDFAWHGFHFPNEVPHRFAFVFSFMLLTLAFEAYTRLEATTQKNIWAVGGILTVYLMLCEKLYTKGFDFKVFYVSMLIVLVYCGVLLLNKYGRLSAGMLVNVLCVAVAAEALLSGINATATAGNSGRGDYPAQKDVVQKALARINEADSGFFRLEMARSYSANDPALYRYHGVSQFASTGNAAFNDFSDKIGLPSDAGANTIAYAPSTPVINSLFSVKYLLSKEDAIHLPNAAYEVIDEYDGLKVLRNRYWVPPGFMMNGDANKWKPEDMSPFKNSESFIENAIGGTANIFDTVPATSETYSNMERTALEEGLRYRYKNINKAEKGFAKLAFTAPQEGQMYVYMLNQTRTVNVAFRGKNQDYETRRGIIIDLGILKAGETFTMDFEVPADETGYFDIHAVMFNDRNYAGIHDTLSSEAFDIKEYSDTSLRGTVNATSAGLLYVSVPYEEGWTATVDGQKAVIVPFQNAVVSIPLSKGIHDVQLTYVPQGIKAGAMISFLALLALLDGCRVLRKKRLAAAKLATQPSEVPEAGREEGESVAASEDNEETPNP